MPKAETHGRSDVEQFLPRGSSHRSSVLAAVQRVLVDVERPGVFGGAFVVDHGTKQEVLAGGKVRVRLEGIDPAEQHYRAMKTGTPVDDRCASSRPEYC